MRDFTAPNAVIFRTASRTPVSANLYTLFMSAPCATVNIVLETLLQKKINDFQEIDSLDISAMTEVGNIIISSYVNAMSDLTGIKMQLSVPSISMNMLGGSSGVAGANAADFPQGVIAHTVLFFIIFHIHLFFPSTYAPPILHGKLQCGYCGRVR